MHDLRPSRGVLWRLTLVGGCLLGFVGCGETQNKTGEQVQDMPVPFDMAKQYKTMPKIKQQPKVEMPH